jgi:hypothetical protein
MTLSELTAILDSMTDSEVSQFCSEFGGGDRSRSAIVREFVDHPEYERRICQLLGARTQEEKMTDAAVCSARSARWSMIWAFVGVAISLGALVVAAVALLSG